MAKKTDKRKKTKAEKPVRAIEKAPPLTAELKLSESQHQLCVLCLQSLHARLSYPWPTAALRKSIDQFRQLISATLGTLIDYDPTKKAGVELNLIGMKTLLEVLADNLSFISTLQGHPLYPDRPPRFSNTHVRYGLKSARLELYDTIETVQNVLVAEFYNGVTPEWTSEPFDELATESQ